MKAKNDEKKKKDIGKLTKSENYPYKFNSKKKEAFLEQFEKTKSITKSALAVGVSKVTIYEHLRTDPEFSQKVNDIKEMINDQVEDHLYKLTKTNPTACIFWLVNRRPDRWRNIQEVKHAGKILLGKLIQTFDDSKYPEPLKIEKKGKNENKT